VIVQAGSAKDVAEAIALARDRGMRVTVRAGRTWWSAPSRDGGMLIDLSRLRRHSVDDGSATAQPGVTSGDHTRTLAAREHAFPVAHSGDVALGEYLVGGGMGWNSRAWGPACAGIEAIEAVTAAGEIIRCDEREHADLLWAARGAGPGFFAAVTSFRLRLRHLPPAIMTTRYVFPLTEIDDAAGWADWVAAAVPANVELSVALTTADREDGSPRPGVVVVTATAFSCAWNDAIRCLEPLRDCPFAERALLRQMDQPTPFAVLFSGSDALWPAHRRAAADSLWLNEGFATLLPALARHVHRAPSAESVVLASLAPGGPARAPAPEMAFAPLGRIHLGCYAMWAEPSADAANLTWLRDLVATAEPPATGHYIAEADLPAAPARAQRSFTPSTWKRLQSLRARYDPDRVFTDYQAAPPP
jgi:FAD/FMN-containing dehydrogenase